VKVLEHVLRKSFGFKNLLWVFSGRRGIHCWVCDPGVHKYDHNIRSAIIKFLHTHNGNDQTNVKADLKTNDNPRDKRMHQMHEDVLLICKEYFTRCILEEQDLFMKSYKKKGDSGQEIEQPYAHDFVEMIRFPVIKDEVNRILRQRQPSTSTEVFQIVEDTFGKYMKAWPKILEEGGEKKNRYNRINGYSYDQKGNWAGPQSNTLMWNNVAEMIFAYVFPRVDIEVTKGVNHLLKGPFCAHPKTGKICVPMDPHMIDLFDPCNQPTLRTLHDQLNEHGDIKKTDMHKAIGTFERTFLNGLNLAWNRHREAMESAMDEG